MIGTIMIRAPIVGIVPMNFSQSILLLCGRAIPIYERLICGFPVSKTCLFQNPSRFCDNEAQRCL